jgi:hypothetical protein
MMTPDEAGAALAADPTFNLMSQAERETEAALLLGTIDAPSDDPLEIALTLELAALRAELAALTAEAGTGVATVSADNPVGEACRNGSDENPAGCGGREPVAANGRCMTCGAYRAAPVDAATAPKAVEPPIAPAKVQKPASEAPVEPVVPKLRHGVTYDPGSSMLGRFKEASGATDKETAAMLGMSRATVQAYAGGRLTEKLTDVQARILIDDIGERLLLLAELKRDIAVLIGEIE